MSSLFVILNPCSKRWSEMLGEGRERFCPECRTYVRAVEHYSSKEIARLTRESTGRLCGYIANESLPQPRSRRAVLLGALLTAISPLMAQDGRTRIRVTDVTGVTIKDAEAYISRKGELPTLTRANEAGEIALTGLPVGDSRIVVSHPGFNSLTLTITIRNAEEVIVDAKLEAGQESLPGNFRKKRKGWWIFR